MKIKKLLSMLIVTIAIMGFTSIGTAYVETEEPYEEYEMEETTSETAEEEEYIAESESEAELMEEEEYKVEEERVEEVAGEGWEELEIPEIY